MKSQFELVVQLAGYRYASIGRGWTRFAFELHARPGTERVSRVYFRDRLRAMRGAMIVGTPRLQAKDYVAIDVDLMDRGVKSFEDFRDVAIDALRRSARAGVGEQYLAVSMFPAASPWLRLKYAPGPAGPDRLGIAGVSTPATYTPWIVTPVGVSQPMFMNMTEFGVTNTRLNVVNDGLPTAGVPMVGGVQLHDRRPSLHHGSLILPSALSEVLVTRGRLR